MPHEDGSAYFPVVATVSLGSSMVLDVVEKVSDNQASNSDVPDTPKSWRIFQEPRSLLLTTGSAYTETLHGIAEVETDENLNNETVANWDLLRDKKSILAADGKSTRQTRISLTFRDVLRVSSIGSKIFGKPKG
jgi:alkylated DNA repair protein alkB family protein 6